jgi:hypothetical protein
MRELVPRVADNPDQFTPDELYYLNRRIIEHIRLLQKARSIVSMSKFHVGDEVWFDHYGTKITGRIIKFNVKTVTIISSDDHRWNVSPGLINKPQ